MRKPIVAVLVAGVALVAIAVVAFRANPKHEIVREAYIYGYPEVPAPAAPELRSAQ